MAGPVRARGSCAYGAVSRRCADRSGVHAELATRPVGEVKLQGGVNGPEGNLIPGDLALVEQPHFKAFGADREMCVEQLGSEKNVNLLYVGHVDH